jgi:hypothetical protein
LGYDLTKPKPVAQKVITNTRVELSASAYKLEGDSVSYNSSFVLYGQLEGSRWDDRSCYCILEIEVCETSADSIHKNWGLNASYFGRLELEQLGHKEKLRRRRYRYAQHWRMSLVFEKVLKHLGVQIDVL